MPEFLPPTRPRRRQMDFHKLPKFVQGYLTAMFWTDCNDDCEANGTANLGYSNLSKKVLKTIMDECADFLKKADPLLKEAYSHDYSEQRAGHDFWLTRNRHGAGFWDRDELEENDLGDRLTELAHEYGEVTVTGYRGWLYHD